MEPSPFPYQGPLRPDEVHGRDQLLAQLAEQVTRREVTALIGPRRYGKTSVLRRLAADLGEVATVWVDLYGVTSAADLALALDAALVGAGPAFSEAAGGVAATFQLELGLVRATLARPARTRPSPELLVPTLLEVLVGGALRVPTLLVLDEFSAVTAVPGAAAKLRTALQHHYRDLGLVFAGSAPSVMRQLFTHREEPFYGQAELVQMPALDAGTVTALVGEGFAATGRQPGAVAARVHDLCGGHPQRTMQTADAVWHATPEGGAVDASTWVGALGELRRRVADPLSRLYDGMARSEQQVLRILAHERSPHGAGGVLLGLGKAQATHARDALLDRGDLIDRDGTLVVTDPLMADWLRTELPLP